MDPALTEVVALVVEAAHSVLPTQPPCQRIRRKDDGSMVTTADLALQATLEQALRHRWPHIPLLGEEMDTDRQQALLSAPGPCWCLDPLDGTSNFAAGLPYYAISLALLNDTGVQLGVVYDPSRQECFSAQQGLGAWLNGQPLRAAATSTGLAGALALIDFKRLDPALAGRLASSPPYASQRSLGAAALDWCWLAAGRVQLYLHGRQMLWDYAAGELILREAGGHSATLAGKSVLQRSLQPRTVVGAPNGDLMHSWQDWLREDGGR